MAIANPFRYRATEQLRAIQQFHRTFGAAMLQAIPEEEVLWDRLIVLRSAPGAGKTSILRLFASDSLALLASTTHPDSEIVGLKQEVVGKGAVSSDRVLKLGIMLTLKHDYRSLADLGPVDAGQKKMLFKLLDARIIRQALTAIADEAGTDTGEISLVVGEDSTAATQLLGQSAREGTQITGAQLAEFADRAEAEVLDLLDSLVPVDWNQVNGHNRLYSPYLLGSATVTVAGVTKNYQPLLLIDDVDELSPEQRTLLYKALLDRNLPVARWLAERQEAVGERNLLGTKNGRDEVDVIIESELARGRRLNQILSHVGNSRAESGLAALEVPGPFATLLEGGSSIDPKKVNAALQTVQDRVERLVQERQKYGNWLAVVKERSSSVGALEAAIDFRMLEILIARDQRKSMNTLFEVSVEGELLGSSKEKEAAALLLSREFQLPYYYGADDLAELSSRNVEQYLNVAGDLFDSMIAAVTSRRRAGSAALAAADQDRKIRDSSRKLWQSIESRVDNGKDVLALLLSISVVALEETGKPNAPYAPGVTGTAIPYYSMHYLFDEEVIANRPGFTRLRRALSSAVANNLIEMSPDISRTKGKNLSILYLNRLLLPELGLPLNRGGFREQTIDLLAKKVESVSNSALDLTLGYAINKSTIKDWPK
jgi:hypothetical protein